MYKFYLLLVSFIFSSSFIYAQCTTQIANDCVCSDPTQTFCDLLPDITVSWQYSSGDYEEFPPGEGLSSGEINFPDNWYGITPEIEAMGRIRVGAKTPNIGLGPLNIRGADQYGYRWMLCYDNGVPDTFQVYDPSWNESTYCPDGSHPKHFSWQRVYHKNSDGSMDFYEVMIDEPMEYHPTHGHMHFNNWTKHTLRIPDPENMDNPLDWEIVSENSFVNFCIMDLGNCSSENSGCRDDESIFNEGTLLSQDDFPNYGLGGGAYGCSPISQGISSGFNNTMGSYLDGMFINIPLGTCNGEYAVVIELTDKLIESNNSNNYTWFPITLTQQSNGPESSEILSSNNGLLCEGESVNLSINTLQESSILWSNGESSNTITIYEPGNYHVEINHPDYECSTKKHFTQSFIPIIDTSDFSISYSEDSIFLNVESEFNVLLYDEEMNIIGSGDSFSFQNTNANYYLANSFIDNNVGPEQHEGSSDYSSSQNGIGFLSFDALSSFTLESISVYADVPAERKFILMNEAGEVIAEHTEFIGFCADEPQVVELNFEVPAGTNYQIGTDGVVNATNLGGQNPQLKRTGTNGGLSYPYVINGKVSINKAVYYGQGVDDIGGDDYTTYYYYLYNWVVSSDSIVCSPTLINFNQNDSNESNLNTDTSYVLVHDNVDMTWYGHYNEWGEFPSDGPFRKVLMHFDMGCASSGCSGWDYNIHILLRNRTGILDSNLNEIIEDFELGRAISPYGNYMNPVNGSYGTNGYDENWKHRYTFDVTDFQHLLKDSVEIDAFYGGWSSGFSVTLNFEFIEGTPPRMPLSLSNVYKNGAAGYGYTNSANFESQQMPEVKVATSEYASSFKLQFVPSGHGQAGEFTPNVSYTAKVNGLLVGGETIWKDDCGFNAIWPQGGTWIFDRANWCPGEAVPIFNHEISSYISPGDSVLVDINFSDFIPNGDASYNCAIHFFQYDEPSFEIDAEVIDIISPSLKDQYSRFNPICSNPVIKIRNSGTQELTALTIEYGLKDGTKQTQQWIGNLKFMQEEEVTLGEIINNGSQNTFEVTVSNPNGTTDMYSDNDFMSSDFEDVPIYNSQFLVRLKTNNYGSQNSWKIENSQGEIVYSNGNFANNTLYVDTILLDNGCFTFTLEDTGGDGLDFWYWDNVGQPDGTGYINFMYYDNISIFKTFHKDFGSRIVHSFRIIDQNSSNDSNSFNCSPTGCLELYDNSGDYESLDDCQAFCDFENLSNCSELFFSEYVEGFSNNKALEIFNPTNQSIDLSNYSIERYSNGSSTVSDEMILSGILLAGQTWVVTNSDTNSTNEFGYIQMELYEMADQLAPLYPSPLYFNGNDAISLSKNGTIIDIIGKIGEDPGAGWTDDATAGFTDANGGLWWTRNHTMIRKSNITQGVTSNPILFNPSAQWDTLSMDDWSNIGYHECACNFSEIYYGCTDPIAYNYNSNAILDDGSCLYCDTITNNFILNPATSINDCNGIAIVETAGGQDPYLYYWNGIQSSNISYLCPGYNILTTYDSNDCFQSDTIFIGPENFGCMDSLACNYDLTANIQDNSCIYPFANLDCDFNCLNDFDLDGICDEDEVFGCTDSNSPNFNALATEDDGSCIICNLELEYISSNSTNQEICDGIIGVIVNNTIYDYTIYVNSIPLISNYYTEACYGENILLIEDDLGCIYNDTLIVEANNIFGCTNPTALNYNPNANSNDGSCEYNELDSLCNFTTEDILGPYFIEGAPITSVLAPEITGVPRLFITGTVYANDCSTTIPNILIDLWHANNEGYYEDENYRGKIYTDEYGSYSFESIKPGKYLNGSYYRPSHIHYKVEYLNSQELSTQLYFEGDSSLDIDPWSSDPSAVNRIIPLVLDEDSNLHGVFNIYLNIDSDECNCILVYGCTSPLAINYNSEATNDDNSCEYEVLENPCDFTPSDLFVDNIIHNRVNFNWSQPEVSPSHYMIRYRPVGTSSWTVMTAGPVNNNPFNGTSRTRYFMEPETTYEWNIRARVLNEDGSTNCQSPWSASSQFTTLPDCPNLENLSVSTEANWVTLNADSPGEEWGVWQSKAKMKELGTNSFRYANGDSYGNINVLKGNFSPNTEYQWHTKAWCTGNVDELGNSDPQYHSGWGDFSYFTTEEVCDKMPINLSTSSNGANTAITMSWDLPLSGTPDHYFLELNNENTGQQWLWNNIPGIQTSKSKFGLTQGEYSWRIRGACGTNGTTWATIFSEPVYYTLGGARFDNDIVSDLNVYPNPSRDVFNISFSSDELQSISIRVVNVIGEEIFKDELTDFDGTYTHELDMTKKSKGVYFLEISSEKGTVNSKMVLQ